MIKPFNKLDLGYFLPNEFSNPDLVLDRLLDPEFEVETMWHNGMVAAILCYRNYWGRCWLGFFLIAEDFPPRLTANLKQHIHEVMIKKDAIRLQTESIACPQLVKWHEYLGFTWEGCRQKMLFDRDYDMWAILRGV